MNQKEYGEYIDKIMQNTGCTITEARHFDECQDYIEKYNTYKRREGYKDIAIMFKNMYEKTKILINNKKLLGGLEKIANGEV